MNYSLNTAKGGEPQTVMIVGVGGTGGYLAETLCRLLTGRHDNIILVDHDVVEPHNLLRQNFGRTDVGCFKSQALAERRAREFNRPVGYVTKPFRHSPYGPPAVLHRANGAPATPDIIVGCVDNAEARADMAKIIPHHRNFRRPWLVDAGNGKNWGQILVGNSHGGEDLHEAFDGDVCHRLPAPVTQRPDIITYAPDEPPDLDCAAAMELADQDPTVNQVMAALTIQVVRRMLAGTCPFMSLYADLDAGVVTPAYATPDNVNRITGVPVEKLKGPGPGGNH